MLLAPSPPPIVVHVDAVPRRTLGQGCLFRIVAPVHEGGWANVCLATVDGLPGPGSTIHSAGTALFALRRGIVRARLRIVQRFAADGVHATQTVTGTIVGGTHAYRGARGTVSGGGSVVDRSTALGPVRLVYRLRFVGAG